MATQWHTIHTRWFKTVNLLLFHSSEHHRAQMFAAPYVTEDGSICCGRCNKAMPTWRAVQTHYSRNEGIAIAAQPAVIRHRVSQERQLARRQRMAAERAERGRRSPSNGGEGGHGRRRQPTNRRKQHRRCHPPCLLSPSTCSRCATKHSQATTTELGGCPLCDRLAERSVHLATLSIRVLIVWP